MSKSFRGCLVCVKDIDLSVGGSASRCGVKGTRKVVNLAMDAETVRSVALRYIELCTHCKGTDVFLNK